MDISPHEQVLSAAFPHSASEYYLSLTTYDIISGNRPARLNERISDSIWDVIVCCWSQDPQSRLPVDSLNEAFVEPVIDMMDKATVITLASTTKANTDYRNSQNTPGRSRNG